MTVIVKNPLPVLSLLLLLLFLRRLTYLTKNFLLCPFFIDMKSSYKIFTLSKTEAKYYIKNNPAKYRVIKINLSHHSS